MSATLISKITSKTIGADLNAAKTAEVALFRIVGIANAVKRGTGNYGEWEKLEGNFEAYVFSTGKSYKATSAFLPNVVNGLIASAIQDGGSVNFAYEIGGKPNKSDNGAGYEFTVKSLMKEDLVSPLDDIKNAVGFDNEAPAIEAPKTRAGKK